MSQTATMVRRLHVSASTSLHQIIEESPMSEDAQHEEDRGFPPLSYGMIRSMYLRAYRGNRDKGMTHLESMYRATTWGLRVIDHDHSTLGFTDNELHDLETALTKPLFDWLTQRKPAGRGIQHSADEAEIIIDDWLAMTRLVYQQPNSHEKSFWRFTSEQGKPAGMGRIYQEYLCRGWRPRKAYKYALKIADQRTLH